MHPGMDASDTTSGQEESPSDAQTPEQVALWLLADRFAELSHQARMACDEASRSAESGELDEWDLSNLHGVSDRLRETIALTTVMVEAAGGGTN